MSKPKAPLRRPAPPRRSQDTQPNPGFLRRSARLGGRRPAGDPDPVALPTSADADAPQVEGQPRGQPPEQLREQTRKQPGGQPRGQSPGQTPHSPLRKRQADRDDDGDDHRPLKRARLTRGNLALLDKMVRKKDKGPSLASASAPPHSTVPSSTIRTVSTTSSGFADQARKNGILHPLVSHPPKNLEDIRKQHARPRESASPPESAYNGYVRAVNVAPNEATMVINAGGDLLKKYDHVGYHPVYNQAFTAFPKDVGFNDGLSAPQPDFIEGLEVNEYDPVPVDELSGAVLYKDDPFSLTLPHLAGEWKGRGKDMDEARLQSAYDGAALVYSRNNALAYIGESDPPGHAAVTTFTADGTNVNFYAHYAAPGKDGTQKYHQYQYASANVAMSYQGHKDGRRGLRNQQDYAREQSHALRDRLQGYWDGQHAPLDPVVEDAPAGTLDDAGPHDPRAGPYATAGSYDADSGAYAVDTGLYDIDPGAYDAGPYAAQQPCQPTPSGSDADPTRPSQGQKKRRSSSSHRLPEPPRQRGRGKK